MPGVKAFYDVNDKTINEAGDKERVERAKTIDMAWAYYDGMHPKPLKVPAGKRDDNIILNLAGRALDKSVEFLGVPDRVEVGGVVEREPDAAGRLVEVISTEQQMVNEFWEINEIDSLVPDLALSGFVAGHSFLRLIPDNPMPMVALLDPRLVSVFWDESNIRRVLWYRLEWMTSDGGKMRQDVVRAEMINPSPVPSPLAERGENSAGWVIVEYVMRRESTGWQEVARDAWEYPFPPIVERKNKRRPHEYYGVSDLAQATTKLNDGVNFVASNTARIIKFHAHPKTIGVGMDAGDVQETAVDGFWTVPNVEAKISNLEMSSDLQSSMQMMETLKAEFFASCRVVDLSTIKDKLGQVTNFGVRMIFNDMLDMIEEKRKTYGGMIAEVTGWAMALMGVTLAARPVCVWRDPLPVNRLEMLQAAQIEAGLGLASKQSLQEDLGRQPDVEAERMEEETQRSGEALARTLETVGQMGGF